MTTPLLLLSLACGGPAPLSVTLTPTANAQLADVVITHGEARYQGKLTPGGDMLRLEIDGLPEGVVLTLGAVCPRPTERQSTTQSWRQAAGGTWSSRPALCSPARILPRNRRPSGSTRTRNFRSDASQRCQKQQQ